MTRPPNFDRVARVYRWAEYIALGPLLQQTRCHWLPLLNRSHKALLLGDGDGRFLFELLAHNSTLTAVAVDTSASMLQLLVRRCTAFAPRLQPLQGSALDAEIASGTDLIVTHFFLDCLTQQEVGLLADRIATHTEAGTLWLVSDFAIPAKPVLRFVAGIYIRSLYLAFRVLTGLRVCALPDIQSALGHAGFKRIAHYERLFGVIYTELWQHK